jgi:hypothetical protein
VAREKSVMSTDSSLAEYDARLARLDSKVRPIAEQRVTDLEEMSKRLKASPPLVQVGEVAEGDSLRTSLEEIYVSTPELREAIWDLFSRYRSAKWVLWPTQKATSEELFRSRLLGVAMRDGSEDPRDDPLVLNRFSREAASACVDIGPILESVAAISSDYVSNEMLRVARDGVDTKFLDLFEQSHGVVGGARTAEEDGRIAAQPSALARESGRRSWLSLLLHWLRQK